MEWFTIIGLALVAAVAVTALGVARQARDAAVEAAESVPLKSEVRGMIEELEHVLSKHATQVATLARERQRKRAAVEDGSETAPPAPGERLYSKAELRQLAMATRQRQ